MATKKELEPKVNMTAEQSPANADGYSSVWQGKIDDVMKKMEERKPFSYDPESDVLYQQHKDRYLSGGRMAMQDAMGQAAAMTGGYGSSYAQSVGQQAHQEYMKGLTDKIPELYQLAYSRYADEGEDLLNQYSLYAGREAQDYSRYLDDRNYNYQLERDAVLDQQWKDEFGRETARINRENKLADAEIAASLGDFSLYEALGYDTSKAGEPKPLGGFSEKDFSEMMYQAFKDGKKEYAEALVHAAGNSALAWQIFDEYFGEDAEPPGHIPSVGQGVGARTFKENMTR